VLAIFVLSLSLNLKFTFFLLSFQLRGRVGRSGREGFAYLFYTDKSLLSRVATVSFTIRAYSLPFYFVTWFSLSFGYSKIVCTSYILQNLINYLVAMRSWVLSPGNNLLHKCLERLCTKDPKCLNPSLDHKRPKVFEPISGPQKTQSVWTFPGPYVSRSYVHQTTLF
jgi:hypothetical protein